VTASLSSKGSRRVNSGPIVCPPLAFAIHFPDFHLLGQPLSTCKYYVCSFPERRGGVRTLKKEVLFNPDEEHVSRSDDDRQLNVQIPPRDFDSTLADLLSDHLPGLLSVAGLCENRGVLPLANPDSRSK
jgi:hypothetical protein